MPSPPFDAVAAAAATGLPLVTIATCGNKRKYDQSFTALRAEAEVHNAVLYESAVSSGMAGAPARSTATAITAASTTGATAGAPIQAAMAGRFPCQTSNATLPMVFFRMVSLNYDPSRRRMVLCTDSSIQGEMPSLPSSSSSDSRSACSTSASTLSPAQPSTGVRGGTEPGCTTPAAAATVGKETNEKEASPHPQSHRRRGSSTSSPGAAKAAPAEVLPCEVDVVLHKVASFASANATRALIRFAQKARAARLEANSRLARQNRSHKTGGSSHASYRNVAGPRPPLVLVDPLDKVNLLTTRCMLYKLLDSEGEDGRRVALIPRTFRWEPPALPGLVPSVTPVGLSSVEEQDKCRANGPPGEKWWVAKPDEGTGPSFTHHLVLWKSAEAEPDIPQTVRAVLPPEASAFVVQEYYLLSLPVVLKVYVVGEHVFVKVSPTVKLLTMMEGQLTRAAQRAAVSAAAGSPSGNGNGLGIPILMDSQDKDMFTAAGLQTATASSSQPGSSVVTPEVSGGVFAASPGGQASNSLQGPDSAVAAATTTTSGVDRTNTSSVEAAAITAGNGAEPLLPSERVRTVVPTAMWDAFLATGTPAHTHLVRLARSLSSCDAGLGLHLYGFDVVLLPRHLAHDYQQAAHPRGFGYAEGPGASPAPQRLSPQPPAGSAGSSDGPGTPFLPTAGTVFAYTPEDMFDLETGAPRPLLMESVPVIIDVNYFPGYKGMVTANANILDLACKCFAGGEPRDVAEGSGSRSGGDGGKVKSKWYSNCTIA